MFRRRVKSLMKVPEDAETMCFGAANEKMYEVGELAERLNAAVSKTVVVARRPEVQILHSPPKTSLMKFLADTQTMCLGI